MLFFVLINQQTLHEIRYQKLKHKIKMHELMTTYLLYHLI